MAIIRQGPDNVIDHLTTLFSKGGGGDSKALAIFGLLPTERKLQIARRSAATFAFGESAPLLTYLAYYGGSQDADRLRAEIERSPDDIGVELARAIVDGRNTAGLSMLRELETAAPGAWLAAPDVRRTLAALWSGVVCELLATTSAYGPGGAIHVGVRLTNLSDRPAAIDWPVAWLEEGPGALSVAVDGKVVPNPASTRAARRTILAPGDRVSLYFDLRTICPADYAPRSGRRYEITLNDDAARQLGCRAVNSIIVHVLPDAAPTIAGDDWAFNRVALDSTAVSSAAKRELLRRAQVERPDLFWDLVEATADVYTVVSVLSDLPADSPPNPTVLLRLLDHRDLAVRRAALRAMERLPDIPSVRTSIADQVETMLSLQVDEVTLDIGRTVVARLRGSADK